ncbi:MAG: NUDIX domain-containing protein [Candidatus Bathyarchaeota archaeon]|nr:NUDIX domain-containing protein [Candidatus Bathyarchaeota archaeon]
MSGLVKPTVRTVALILLRDGKLLVERRTMDKLTDPGVVVVPGGHVEEGESLVDACRRELREELGLTCDCYECVDMMTWETPHETQLVHYHLCEGWEGEPRCNEAEEVFFIGMDELTRVDIETERIVLAKLFASKKGKVY